MALEIGTECFTWAGDVRTFCAEVSELTYNFPDLRKATSFFLVSEKTETKVLVMFSETLLRGNEVIGWTFVPVDVHMNFKVVIYND
jgi:hypothetical protein